MELTAAGNWHSACNVYPVYFHMEATSVAPPQYRTPDGGNAVMKRIRQPETNEQEPIGIIISGGFRVEEPPRFSAYVWGPVPPTDVPVEDGKPVAA